MLDNSRITVTRTRTVTSDAGTVTDTATVDYEYGGGDDPIEVMNVLLDGLDARLLGGRDPSRATPPVKPAPLDPLVCVKGGKPFWAPGD